VSARGGSDAYARWRAPERRAGTGETGRRVDAYRDAYWGRQPTTATDRRRTNSAEFRQSWSSAGGRRRSA